MTTEYTRIPEPERRMKMATDTGADAGAVIGADTCCQLSCSDEDDKMLDEAENFVNSLSTETYERMMAEGEEAREDYQRAVEETERQELAEEQAAKDEADPEYQQKLQKTAELKVGEDHQVLIKGFNASRIDSEGTVRIQALLPAIVSKATKEMEFTGELPALEMDERGRIWATVENWDQEEGGATGEFDKHTAEMKFDKSEEELNAQQKDALTQQQMDTQLHWNFHTIHEILFTDEDRLEVERICIEHSQTKPGWEKEVSEYAALRAKQGRIDEVFCEFGKRFMTDVRTSPDKPTKFEKLNPELYGLIKDRLERLSRLSEILGLKIGVEK